MSDTNRVAIRVAKDAVYGTADRAVAFTALPFTGTSDMGATPETVVSEVIRSDRQISDLIKVNESVGGSFDTELGAGAFDLLFDGVMQNTASSEAVITEGAAFDDNNLAVLADGSSLSVGDIVMIEDAANTVKAYTTVESINGTTSFSLSAAGFAGEVSASDIGATCDVTKGATWVNGVTPASYTFERQFTDTTVVEYMEGMEMDSFSISASAGSIVTASFGMLGRQHQVQDGRDAGASTAAETSFSPYNGSSNLAALGAIDAIGALTVCTEMSIEVTNNLRERNALGTTGAISIGSGEFGVTGSMNVYFEDKSRLEQLLNNTQTSLTFGFDDGSGNVLFISLPAIKFSEGVPEISGKNEDVMLNLSFQAFAAGGAGTTMKIAKFTAA